MSDKSSKTLESMSQAVWYNKWTLEQFKNYLKGDILDIGCGIGNFTGTLSQFGNVYGIDVNETYVENFGNRDNLNIGLGDIEKGKYFFKNQKFDSIVCLNVLEHIKDDKAALKNIHNLLKDNGTLILLVPIHKFLYGEIDKAIDHHRRYNPGNLRALMQELNFKILKAKKINFLGAIGWFIAGRILKNTQVDNSKIKIFNWVAPLFLLLENIFEPPFGTSLLLIARKKER